MEAFLPVLFWIGIATSAALILMLLISIVGLGDLDTDFDGDGAGLGFVKSILVFTAVSSLTIRAAALNSGMSSLWVVLIGVGCGIVAILFLSAILRFLLSRQEEGNWYLYQLENQIGKTYIPIPENGLGKISIEVGGVKREVDAKSSETVSIPTGTKVKVVEVDEDFVWVSTI